ncbi:MAG: GDP-mannose 4,6-dehydratase [Prolixibacteraceae bacterium]
MTRILVTGCAGFIGSHLTEQLLAQNYQVVGIDNFDPFYDKSIKNKNLNGFINHPNFEFLELDLTDQQKLLNNLSTKIDLVIHLAGKAGVRPSIDDPNSYIQNNIVATQNILDLMKLKGIKKLAFASSSSIYGNTKTVPFNENMDVSNPISPYAATKKACELINHTYHHLHHIDIINMRFFTVFGPRQRPDLAIHKFTKLIRKGEQINMFGDGSSARDYTYVDDTVAGIIGTMDYLLEHENVYETINLGNNQPVLLRDLIATIYDATGATPNIRQLPMQPGDVDITYANISKAKQLIGYQPKFNFNEGVKKFVEWYDKLD